MAREPELYKDKIEVSLDGRQIFYLFFGGAVIVGLVFVLGVMVGRRVEARGHLERAHVETAVDPLAALDRLEGGTSLSFQTTLRGAEPPASDVEKKIGELAKQKEPAKKDDKKAEPAKKEDKKPEPEKKAEPEKKEDKKAEPEKKAELDKKAEPEKKEDKKAESEKKAELDKKAESEKKEEKKPRFTLQLSSFQDKNEAEAYVQSVKSSGFSAYVTQGDVDGKQYYRVRLGSYRSLDAANDAKAEFEKSLKKSALVTRL